MCVCVVCVGKKPPRHISGRYPTMEQEHLYSISSYTHQLGKHPGGETSVHLMSMSYERETLSGADQPLGTCDCKIINIMDGKGPNGGLMDYTLFSLPNHNPKSGET